MSTRVALWGYGSYGRTMEAAFQSSAGQYVVTAVFDRQYRQMNQDSSTGKRILDPDRITRYYRQGLFDTVAVTIYDNSQRNILEQSLQMQGIPVLTYSSGNLKEPPESRRVSSGLTVEQPGYHLCSFTGQHLTFFTKDQKPLVFDENGSINSLLWQAHRIPALYLFRPKVIEPELRLEGECCLLDMAYSDNYGHFTFETLDKIWLLEQAGYKGRYILPRTGFSPDLVRLLGIEEKSRVLWSSDLDRSRTYKIDKLICLTSGNGFSMEAAPVLVKMAEQILGHLPTEDKAWPDRIYVKRVGVRRLLHADRVLEKYDFRTIIPEEFSVEEQIQLFHHAKIVFSPHGANTANSLYMNPGTALIETFPTDYTAPTSFYPMFLKNVHYLPVTEPVYPAGQRDFRPYADYSIPEEMLESAIRNAINLTRGA